MRATTLAVAVAFLIAGCTSSADTGSKGTGSTGTSSPSAGANGTGGGSTPPAPASASWGLPADTSAAVRAAGLPMLGHEELAVHYHVHLDVFAGGQQVPVPADIGIDEAKGLIAPLHTHDDSGVVHIESATDVPFTLGQVFTEWGQPLSATTVGPLTLGGGQVLRVFRDGQPVTGDPAALRLVAHDEIAVWVGPGSQQPQVPSSYAFPAGL
jgi:hypothetical protein